MAEIELGDSLLILDCEFTRNVARVDRIEVIGKWGEVMELPPGSHGLGGFLVVKVGEDEVFLDPACEGVEFTRAPCRLMVRGLST